MQATAAATSFENQRVRDTFDVIRPNSIWRDITVRPAMSGHNSLFIGQVGDWTWEAVSELCGTDVFNARNSSGAPTYLAFYYIHMRTSPSLHSTGITFGDRLEAVSSVYDFGSESILTLHRIRKSGSGEMSPVPIDLEEFFEAPSSGCMYIQTFNRWVARSKAASNQDLMTSSPVDFQHEHLGSLPDKYSPRLPCGHARRHHTFHDVSSPEYVAVVDGFTTTYKIDITRDINGVGLVYFASYFSIIDGSHLKLWTHLGRAPQRFLNRIVLDHKVCYLANAETDSVLTITMKAWRRIDDGRHEVFNTRIEDQQTGKVIAVSTTHLLSEAFT